MSSFSRQDFCQAEHKAPATLDLLRKLGRLCSSWCRCPTRLETLRAKEKQRSARWQIREVLVSTFPAATGTEQTHLAARARGTNRVSSLKALNCVKSKGVLGTWRWTRLRGNLASESTAIAEEVVTKERILPAALFRKSKHACGCRDATGRGKALTVAGVSETIVLSKPLLRAAKLLGAVGTRPLPRI